MTCPEKKTSDAVLGFAEKQNRPLCNVGLVLKSYMEGVLAMTLGAWLVFTESYTTILDAALLGPTQQSVNIEWVDDAFFGYVCTAKVRMRSYNRKHQHAHINTHTHTKLAGHDGPSHVDPDLYDRRRHRVGAQGCAHGLFAKQSGMDHQNNTVVNG